MAFLNDLLKAGIFYESLIWFSLALADLYRLARDRLVGGDGVGLRRVYMAYMVKAPMIR